MEDDKILEAEEQEIDSNLQNIRPQSLDEYVGQKEITDNLRVFINSSVYPSIKCIVIFLGTKFNNVFKA